MPLSTDKKIFEDSVHGHIAIPRNYCKYLIDTIIFQRLRRVEQTSMRPIFPSAHHDRFIHSLGVFHVGSELFKHLRANTQAFEPAQYNAVNDLEHPHFAKFHTSIGIWDLLQETYQAACLLHDCGHAPFSHTFEKFYKDENSAQEGDPLTIPIYKDLIKEYEDCVKELPLGKSEAQQIVNAFKRDLANCKPAPHEVASAWLMLHSRGFRRAVIDHIKADPLLAARMIIGCRYRDASQSDRDSSVLTEQILNCFISMLNGHEIDADRLDYAARDQWATGLHTTQVNLERLFSSIFITNHEGKFIVCFKKQGVTELQVLLDAKNYTAFWIFSHHKIKYHEDLLVKAVERLAILLQGDKIIQEYQTYKNEQRTLTGATEEEVARAVELKEKCDSIGNTALCNLFDYRRLVDKKEYVYILDKKEQSESLYLMSDDDIIHLLKKYFCAERKFKNGELRKFIKEAPYALEWFSRDQEMIPLWKSYSEYNALYLRGFALEVQALARFKVCLCEETAKRKKSSEQSGLAEEPISTIDCRNWLDSDPELKKILGKITRDPCVKEVIKRYANYIDGATSSPHDVLKEIHEDIDRAIAYFSESGVIQDVLLKIAHEVIEHFGNEGYHVNPGAIKQIKVDNLSMKEIAADSVYVEIKKQPYCYTELNIPQRSRRGDYNFPYFYMPKASTSRGDDLDARKYSTHFLELLKTYPHPIWE